MPLPAAAGDATVPSVVDVYVNNILQGSRDVAPGPFELANIPVPSGGGTVQLVVRDLLGREVVSEQAYYASNRLLRRGLHDFSYEAGFLRRGFGRRSNDYGEFMASTTHRYGFSDRLTGEAHLQASQSRQMAGAALTWAAFDLGQVGGSTSVSHSERGMGYRFAGSFERRMPGLSFGILSEYTSANYSVIGMPDNYRPPRMTVQAFADLPIRRGSIGVNLLHRSLRGEADETLAGVFASYQVTGRAFLHLYARRAVGRSNETVFGAHLSLALGGRRTAFASVEQSRGGPSGHVSFQQNPPAGTGNGYRVEASLGEVDRIEAAFVRQLPMATVGVQAAHVNGSTGLRVSATGGIGLVGGRLFASRSLGDSFAAVRLDGYPGVRVYADDQLVGVTDRSGRLVVPGLRPFEPNRLRIDDADLPLDARVEATELVVRPFARTGSVVAFPVRPERGVVVQLRREDGSAVPAGARLSVEGMDGDYVVASGGEAYVPDMTGRRLLTASWAGGRCSAVAEVPDNDDPQPRLDGLICREEARYAAH
jgi:outer membrane usher protein